MGRTLEEMDELFGAAGMAAADSERKARIESDIGLLALVGVETPETEKVIDTAHSEKVLDSKNDAPIETTTEH